LEFELKIGVSQIFKLIKYMEYKENLREAGCKVTFTHTGSGINIMTCDFGHDVKVLVDYPNCVIQKKYGAVTVDEFPIDYFDWQGWNLFLSNIGFEVEEKVGKSVSQ